MGNNNHNISNPEACSCDFCCHQAYIKESQEYAWNVQEQERIENALADYPVAISPSRQSGGIEPPHELSNSYYWSYGHSSVTRGERRRGV